MPSYVRCNNINNQAKLSYALVYSEIDLMNEGLCVAID